MIYGVFPVSPQPSLNYAIQPILPEVGGQETSQKALIIEYNYAGSLMMREVLGELLHRFRLMVDNNLQVNGEMLR